jgi:hypothetical protein
MAIKRDIIITIGSDGGVNIAVEGVPGADCLDFTKFLEDELGEVTERVHTTEYYQEEEEVVKIKVGK